MRLIEKSGGGYRLSRKNNLAAAGRVWHCQGQLLAMASEGSCALHKHNATGWISGTGGDWCPRIACAQQLWLHKL